MIGIFFKILESRKFTNSELYDWLCVVVSLQVL
jgi:hypothetical protein